MDNIISAERAKLSELDVLLTREFYSAPAVRLTENEVDEWMKGKGRHAYENRVRYTGTLEGRPYEWNVLKRVSRSEGGYRQLGIFFLLPTGQWDEA